MFVDVFPFSMFPYCSYIQRGKNNPLPVIYCFSLGCKELPQEISQGGMGAGWDKLALAPSYSVFLLFVSLKAWKSLARRVARSITWML